MVIRRLKIDRDVVIGFAVVIAIMVGAVVMGPRSAFVSDAARMIEQAIAGAPYVGYYLDLDARDADQYLAPRLMFAPGQLPGIPAVPNVSKSLMTFGHTEWSADGEHMLVFAGPSLYIGDRRGQIRKVADLAPEYHFLRASWLGKSDEVFAIVRSRDGGTFDKRRWTTRLRIGGSGPEVPHLIPGRLSFEGIAFVSEDAHWIVSDRRFDAFGTAGCLEEDALYNVAGDRLNDLVDGQGRNLQAIGWLSDGRLASAFCSVDRGTIDIFVDAPENRPSRPIATLGWKPLSAPPIVDRTRDRILYAPGGGSERATLLSIDPSGRRAEVGRIPSWTKPDEQAFLVGLSRGDQYLSVRAYRLLGETPPDLGGAVFNSAGVIDMTSGQFADACPSALPTGRGCLRLALR